MTKGSFCTNGFSWLLNNESGSGLKVVAPMSLEPGSYWSHVHFTIHWSTTYPNRQLGMSRIGIKEKKQTNSDIFTFLVLKVFLSLNSVKMWTHT